MTSPEVPPPAVTQGPDRKGSGPPVTSGSSRGGVIRVLGAESPHPAGPHDVTPAPPPAPLFRNLRLEPALLRLSWDGYVTSGSHDVLCKKGAESPVWVSGRGPGLGRDCVSQRTVGRCRPKWAPAPRCVEWTTFPIVLWDIGRKWVFVATVWDYISHGDLRR